MTQDCYITRLTVKIAEVDSGTTEAFLMLILPTSKLDWQNSGEVSSCVA